LLDYSLQGDFMAKAKNHKTPIPGTPWALVLASHAAIHAGGVALFLPMSAAAMEFAAHLTIDYGKTDGWFGQGSRGFIIDQFLHVMCKVTYVTMFAYGII
jgi:hypothetical protein